jgi:hypothetical protein
MLWNRSNDISAATTTPKRLSIRCLRSFDRLKYWRSIPAWDGPVAWREGAEIVLGSLSYVLPYVHQGDTIIILRVVHEAMKWPESF